MRKLGIMVLLMLAVLIGGYKVLEKIEVTQVIVDTETSTGVTTGTGESLE